MPPPHSTPHTYSIHLDHKTTIEKYLGRPEIPRTHKGNMATRLDISNIIFMALVVMAMLHRSSAQTTHVVGDALGWTFPPGGEVAYRTWAFTQNFSVGDVLLFNFTTGTHDVAKVTKDSFDSCNGNNPISLSTDGPANITLTSSGEHHFICTFTGHCDAGMKLSINVVGSPAVSPAPSPAETTTPPPVATPAPAPVPARAAMTYTVGDSLGWTVPPGGPVAYQTWARGKSFFVGDTLVFNFATNRHDVVEVNKAEYDSCNTTSTAIITASPARITLNSSGEHYYICTIPGHCPAGQKLAINVTAGSATATPPSGQAPSPSSGATPPPRSVTPVSPSTPSSTPPSGTTTAPPPPDSSAPSLAVATLPLTFLAVAFAVLYN